MRALACVARGGHRWETVTDPMGSVTSCARCGSLRRNGMLPANAFLRSHTNMGYRLGPRDRDSRQG